MILVVAVLIAIAGSARTKNIGGKPVPGPVPDPPRVGDCLLEPGAPNPFADSADFASLRTGPCDGARFGEVAAVLTDGLRAAARRPGTGDGTPVARCAGASDDYLGVAAGTGDPDWHPEFWIGTQVIEPTLRQQAAGQTWLACLVTAPPGPGPGTYRVSLRGAVRDNSYPSEFATCVPSMPNDPGRRTYQRCDLPHRAEVLGSTVVPLSVVDTARVRDSCHTLAATLIGRSDPTAGGRLVLDIAIAHTADMIWIADGDATLTDAQPAVEALCVAEPAGTGRLTGPLLGLGNTQLPLG